VIVKQRFPQIVALHDPHSQPEIKLTYSRKLNYPDKGVAVTSSRLGNNPFWYGVTDREIVPMLFPSPLADVPNY
jgi:hypothetical protein